MITKATFKTIAFGFLLVTSSVIGFAMQKPSESTHSSIALKNIEALSATESSSTCPSPYDHPAAYLATDPVKKFTLKCSVDGSISYEGHTLTGGFRAGVSYLVLAEAI